MKHFWQNASPGAEDGDQVSRSELLGVSLPPRTIAGFVAATLAVILILFLSYRSLQTRSEGGKLVAQTLEVTGHLQTLLSTLKDAETGQRGFLLTGQERYLEPYEDAVALFPREIERTRQAIAGDAEQARRFASFERFSAEKMAELKRTVDLKRGGRGDDALGVVREDHGRIAMVESRGVIVQMMDAEHRRLDERTHEWEQAISLSAMLSWGGSGLLLFLIGTAATMSGRDFRGQRVEVWLRSGQTRLGQRMQGPHDIGKLGDSVAAFLAEYLDAQLCAVYFVDAIGVLKRVGGYGLAAGTADPVAGGGLTKQALEGSGVLSVHDVPDDYFSINSGLGKSRPRHLLLAPTSVDGVSNGVIELAFFHPISDYDTELLRRIAEPTGMALRTAKYRKELQNLLEETQRQAEELQTQQEELRVQNEELEEQSRVLQESQERLQNQQAELEQINSQLEEQTQLLEAQRDDLSRAQATLQKANTYKSEFLANMSHELRTPLNSSLILAKLLLDNREGNMTPEQVKFAQTIYSAGNDLLTLINDILDLSKIEAGKLDVRPENVSVGRLVDDLMSTFLPIAQERKLELTATVEDAAPRAIHTDSTRLQQILKNLLSNALKFTERGGVSLRIRRSDDGAVAFDVKDTGIGIPAEQHDLVFQAFRQADGASNRKYGGTGLGLSISRDLARLLGGSLALESARGQGSTFTLTLPEANGGATTNGVHLPARPAASMRHAPVAKAPLPLRASPGAADADDRDRITTGARTILVIEDDVAFARTLYGLAHELDFLAVIAQSAEEGLALAERLRPSAIVLDVGLPDRSGLSVLDALKHNPATRHIPVHMASVSDLTQAALQMGAAGYAIKPIEREQLIEALKRLEAKFTQKVHRVLVVEDDERHRESTCLLLAGDDVETVAVGTAKEALRELAASTFDCMVLDLTLPDGTGFDLLEDMSQKEQYAFPPVIVYTGRSLSRDDEQRLRRFSSSIVIKGARSPERLLDEVTLFLHQVESKLPPDRQRMLRDARHREAVFEGRRVLVVEDDVRNIFALSSVLEPKGAKVEIARNGREAIEHLAAKPGVDLVLMDIMMPEMDGLQATREIRSKPENAKLPIIALTAKAMADDREQCMAAGASDYIAKPLDVDKLLSLARVWMPK